MTKNDVAASIAQIEAHKDHPNIAHEKEDELYASVLRSIANGTCDDSAGCAALALTTENIKFSRWYD